MRLAVSGTHRTGKTTLVEGLAAHLPEYVVVDEPYRALEDDGHEFSDPPTVEDFELQLRRSLAMLAEPRAHVIFDRCPVDLVAYLQVLDRDFEIDECLDELRDAMASLDLVIVLGIEDPDRVAVGVHEDRRLRRRVDDRLRALLLDDPFELGMPTLEVSGTVDDRLQRVMRALRAGGQL